MHRDLHRYWPSQGTWETLRAGAELGVIAVGDSWIMAGSGQDSIGPAQILGVDGSSGTVTTLAARPPGKWGLQFQNGHAEMDRSVVFDSYPDNEVGERSLCRWRLDPFAWETLAGPIPDSAVELWAKRFGGWIYWANERVHVDTLERQSLFNDSGGLDFVWGYTVLDQRLWILNGSNCGNEGGCFTGGDGGLYYVDLAGPASEYPKRIDVQANAYDVRSSRLETDGERLYWQRRNYEDPMGFYRAQIVAFDPVTEELEVVFVFEEWGTGLSDYRVVGEYLYAIRHDDELKPIASLERLSLIQ